MTQEKKIPRIKCVGRMKEIMTHYYIEAKTAEQTGKKVAWITSGGPVEPLIAMDIIPVYPENHGAMIGAAKMGGDLCDTSEEMGYSRDLCSYARADIACSTNNGGPIGGLPRPDMLICCNNICGTVLKWYEVQARYYGVPLFILDTPVLHNGYNQAAKTYVKKQIVEYLEFLENACGQKLDMARLHEVNRISFKGSKAWMDVLNTTTRMPSPMTCFDAFFHLALIVTLRGKQVVVDYYRELLDELNQRWDNGIYAVPNEKYRLLWDNIPIWYRIKWLSQKFISHDACLVADTYTSAWLYSFDYINPDNPIESLADSYTVNYLNVGVDAMGDTVTRLIDKYHVDGMVMHSNRSCKPYSFAQMEIQRIVAEKRGIPTLMIEADMTDERIFSESQIETRIDAFMELIAQG